MSAHGAGRHSFSAIRSGQIDSKRASRVFEEWLVRRVDEGSGRAEFECCARRSSRDWSGVSGPRTKEIPLMDEYESLSHTTWVCNYHVVFIRKCRCRTAASGRRPRPHLSAVRGERVLAQLGERKRLLQAGTMLRS